MNVMRAGDLRKLKTGSHLWLVLLNPPWRIPAVREASPTHVSLMIGKMMTAKLTYYQSQE